MVKDKNDNGYTKRAGEEVAVKNNIIHRKLEEGDVEEEETSTITIQQ